MGYNAATVWYRVPLPGTELEAALEQLRLMNALSAAILKANVELAARVGTLRSTGLAITLREDQIEIYVDHERGRLVWLLNDAALEACRRTGEKVTVEGESVELPPPPPGPLARSLLIRSPLYSADPG